MASQDRTHLPVCSLSSAYNKYRYFLWHRIGDCIYCFKDILYFVQLEFKVNDEVSSLIELRIHSVRCFKYNAKVVSSTAESPKEIWVLVVRYFDDGTVCEKETSGDHVIVQIAVLPLEAAYAGPQRDPEDASTWT